MNEVVALCRYQHEKDFIRICIKTTTLIYLAVYDCKRTVIVILLEGCQNRHMKRRIWLEVIAKVDCRSNIWLTKITKTLIHDWVNMQILNK